VTLEAATAVRREAMPTSWVALPAGWLIALIAYCAVAAWLFAHPATLSSDDALFFLRGLTRFSILDFSPQFPGYPGFIAMGRLLLPLAASPLAALGLLTTLLALSLPPLAALIVARNGYNGWPALASFVLTLAMPLLPDMALSLLSDGAGIAFVLAGLALLPQRGDQVKKWPAFLAGVALGWAAACRPSDAAMLGGAAAGALAVAPRLFWPACAGFLGVVLPALAIMLAIEPLYFSEGLRFTAGHALIWGNTPFSAGGRSGSWLETLAGLPGGLALAVLLAVAAVVSLSRLRTGPPALAAATIAIFAHGIWIVAFQNPDSIRHLAPLLVLGPLVLAFTAKARPRVGMAAVVLCLGLEFWSGLSPLRGSIDAPPPLVAAERWLGGQPVGTALATNDGVFLLRGALPAVRVYDMHYPEDARLGLALAAGPTYRLTSTQVPGQLPLATFAGRFAGEPTLWLYPVLKTQ
jgi:hypothetical protein